LAQIIDLNIYLQAIICAAIGGLLYLLLILALKIVDLQEIKGLASHVMNR